MRLLCLRGFGLGLACCSLFCLTTAKAEILKVGSGEEFTSPCQAIGAASDGDVIEIAARSDYAPEACSWRQNRLTLRGIGGRARVAAAMWEIFGRGTVIENIEFSGHRDGVAVLSHSGDVTVRDAYFHNGGQALVVESGGPGAAAVVERSEFAFNGAGDASQISVGAIGRFVLRDTFVHDADGGSLVASSAARNEMRDNRFSSAAGGTTRQELVFTAGTRAELTGNVFEKNVDAIGASVVQYVFAGLHPERAASELVAEGNTFISKLAQGVVFVDVPAAIPATLRIHGNIFFGAGVITNREEDFSAGNYQGDEPGFEDLSSHDYRLRADSEAQGFGATTVNQSGFPLRERGMPAASSTSASRMPAVSNSVAAGIASVTLSPNSVSGVTWTFANTITLSAPAPSGGLSVNLSASDSKSVSVGPRIVIGQGQMSANFLVKVISVAQPENVSITASSSNSSRGAILKLAPNGLSSIVLNPVSVGGGLTSISNQVRLAGPAPAGGVIVSVWTSNASVATVPSSVKVAAGVSVANFTITTRTVPNSTPVMVTGSFSGTTAQAQLTVNPVQLASVVPTPSVGYGGVTVNLLTINLNGPAPAGGSTVRLSSSNTAVIALPSSVTVPAGATVANILFATQLVSAQTVVTLAGSYNGGTKSANMTVLPRH